MKVDNKNKDTLTQYLGKERSKNLEEQKEEVGEHFAYNKTMKKGLLETIGGEKSLDLFQKKEKKESQENVPLHSDFESFVGPEKAKELQEQDRRLREDPDNQDKVEISKEAREKFAQEMDEYNRTTGDRLKSAAERRAKTIYRDLKHSAYDKIYNKKA